jgi:hypothetical protein
MIRIIRAEFLVIEFVDMIKRVGWIYQITNEMYCSIIIGVWIC